MMVSPPHFSYLGFTHLSFQHLWSYFCLWIYLLPFSSSGFAELIKVETLFLGVNLVNTQQTPGIHDSQPVNFSSMALMCQNFHNGYKIIREAIFITVHYYKYLDFIFCANDADIFLFIAIINRHG